MKMYVIMIENMILTMSRYFFRKNRSITNINKLSAHAIIKFKLDNRLTPLSSYKLDNGVSRKFVYIRYRPMVKIIFVFIMKIN